MDVRLPGRNGVESFLEIRRRKPGARVYMMTGFSVEQLLEDAIAGGARGVLHKPLDLQRLLNLLKEIKPEGILIADDDVEFVASVSEVLAENGYRVGVARDGREAVKRVLDNGFDVLILDLRLPGLDGMEVYMELKTARAGNSHDRRHRLCGRGSRDARRIAVLVADRRAYQAVRPGATPNRDSDPDGQTA